MSGLELAHPDDVETLRLAITEGARTPRAGNAEARLSQRDGSWRWFDVIITDLSADPSVNGWVANLRDITERKAQDAALNEAQRSGTHSTTHRSASGSLISTDVSNGQTVRWACSWGARKQSSSER